MFCISKARICYKNNMLKITISGIWNQGMTKVALSRPDRGLKPQYGTMAAIVFPI